MGFVDVEVWRLPLEVRGEVAGYDAQSVSTSDVGYVCSWIRCRRSAEAKGQANDYQNAIDLVQTSGARVVHPVFITPPQDWLVEGGTNVDDLMGDILSSQASAGCECYLGTLEGCDVKTLSDIIAFNNANAEKEFDDGNVSFHLLFWSIDADIC